MTSPPSPEHRDFFISYTGVDEKWATWVADVLEANDYHVYIQAWDFKAGNNFVVEMQRAASMSDRTLLIMSPNFLKSLYVQPEWATAFAKDPTGSDGRLVPVIIEPCEPPGLLAPLIHINLVGRDSDSATKELLSKLAGGRAKPMTRVPFPGQIMSSPAVQTSSASGSSLRWSSVPGKPEVKWHGLDRNNFSPARTTLEVHAVPVPPRRLEVRRLRELPDDLILIGRQKRFFSNTAEIKVNHSAEMAMAETATGRYNDEVAGLLVTRSGQRTAWLSVPKDGLGPVYDPDWVQQQIENVLRILFQLPLEPADEYAFAVAITSPMMLTKNSVSVLGQRTSSGGMRMSEHPITVEPEDSVAFSSIAENCEDIAEELAAQLSSAFDSKR